MRVLIPIDGSECSKAAVDYVKERPWNKEDTFLLVHVVEPIPVDIGIAYIPAAYTPDDGAAFSQSEALLKVVQGDLTSALTNPIETKVIAGPAKAEIVDLAQEWKADLIVMGSHGRKGFNRLLLGSVTEDVMKSSPCSVTIVKSAHCSKSV
ncbi:universal stress protein [bacterium]|jgi:nucleotide-binding universal stress UspA family protein|nr:universal stress protein [bacterium]